MAADRPSLTGEANIGLRTSNERPNGPPLAADASVVTAVANMPEAAARFARAGPQERSTHFPTPHSPASAKPLPLRTFPCRAHAFTYCSLAARLPYAGESSQLMAGRRQGHRGSLPRRPRAARRRRPGRPGPLHRAKASSSTCVQSGAASGHRAILDLMSHVISGSMSVVCMRVVKERAPRSCCVRPSVLPSELPLLPLLVRGVNRVAWYCSRCRASLRVPSGPSERSFYVLYSGLGYGLMHAKTPRGTARSPLSSEVFPIIVMSG